MIGLCGCGGIESAFFKAAFITRSASLGVRVSVDCLTIAIFYHIMDEPFTVPALKIERAKCHIAEFEAALTDFLADEPYRIVADYDLRSRKATLIVRVYRAVPGRLATVLGDAIHNLRSALDFLAVDLVRLNGGNVAGVYFPFASEAGTLESAITDKKVNRAAPEVVDLIRALKPYKGGNDALRGLHDLDVMDKHKALVPTLPSFTVDDSLIGPNRLRLKNVTFGALKDGTKLVSGLQLTDALKLKNETECGFQVTLAEPSIFEGQPVVPTLHQLAQLTVGIVETFEAHCLRS